MAKDKKVNTAVAKSIVLLTAPLMIAQILPLILRNMQVPMRLYPGNTKGGSITIPLTSCLIGLE